MKNQKNVYSDSALEQNLIGCLLLDNKIWFEVRDIVSENCFSIKTHQLIFKAISALIAENKLADPITVFPIVKPNLKEADSTFSEASLFAMEQEVYAVANAKLYAEQLVILSKKRTRQQLIDELATCSDDARIIEITNLLRDFNQTITFEEKPIPIQWDEFALPVLREDYFKGLNASTWFWDMIVSVRDTTETPLEIVFGLGLSVLATALQKKFIVEIHKSYSEPLNLWTLGALGPGNRKSAIVKSLIAPITQWENSEYNRIMPEIKRLEQLLLATPKNAPSNIEIPTVPRLLTMDVTPEKLAMIMADNGEKMSIISAEGGIFELMAGKYYGKGGPNLDVFNQAHIGDRIRVDRTTRDTIILEHPALTFGLLAQPSVITSLAAVKDFRNKGTLGRFLYFVPKSSLGNRTLQFKSVPKMISDKYNYILNQAISYNPKFPVKLFLTPEAFRLWKEFSLDVEKKMATNGQYESIVDWAAKFPGLILRLCGIMHCAYYAEYGLHVITNEAYNVINEVEMQKILDLVPLFSSHAMTAFGLLTEDETVSGAKKILKWISACNINQFTRRECYHKHHRNFKDTWELTKSLKVLCDREFIKLTETKLVSNQKSYVYLVNSSLHP